jgi:hypothetical protein
LLHGVAEQIIEFKQPIWLARNDRVTSVRRFKHRRYAVGQHRLQGQRERSAARCNAIRMQKQKVCENEMGGGIMKGACI